MKLLMNNWGMVGFPVYLLVAIIISSIVLVGFAFSILQMHNDAQAGIVQTQIEKITSEAENMFEYADAGTMVTVSVDFPDSMRFIVFGSLPRNGGSQPSDLTLDEDMSNSYYFVLKDGNVKTFSSNARFSGESTDEIALLFPGRYNICVELEQDSGGVSFVKIYKK